MRQKYTVTVADVSMNIVCDESQEAVNEAVTALDAQMRSLGAASNNCTKTEAALLCALDYCADKLKAQRRVKRLEALNAEYEMRIAELEEELEKANR